MSGPLLFEPNDGGRSEHFKGVAGDCVARAIAIATGRPYGLVYEDLADMMADRGKPRSARNGIDKKVIRAYMESIGWEWTPTMGIGTGCRVHLAQGELPFGPWLVVSLSRHVSAVREDVVYDTYDPTRDGTRCVYGYWKEPGIRRAISNADILQSGGDPERPSEKAMRLSDA